MDRLQIIERLISIKNNSYRQPQTETANNPYLVKAMLLEGGINQLILEIQNSILAEQHHSDNNWFSGHKNVG